MFLAAQYLFLSAVFNVQACSPSNLKLINVFGPRPASSSTHISAWRFFCLASFTHPKSQPLQKAQSILLLIDTTVRVPSFPFDLNP